MQTDIMKPLIIASALLSGAQLIHAHTRFTTLHINGVSVGDGTCIRQDPNPGTTTNFVPSITGPEMACGIGGDLSVPDTCPVAAGDSISLEHRMWPDASEPGAIDVSHKGNTAIYMKKVNGMSEEVTGDGWFKIYWDGYDAATGLWGTDNMNANNGLVSTRIPSDLAGGDYLIRSEVLALQVVGDPQMYVGCAQVQVSGSGAAVPSSTTSIPGYIDTSTPAMQVNIYESFTFQEYGPPLYGSGGSKNSTSAISSTTGGKTTGNSTSPTVSAGSSSAGVSAPAATKVFSSVATTSTANAIDASGKAATNSSSNAATPVDETLVENDEDSSDGSGEDSEDAGTDASPAWSSWGRWNNGRARIGGALLR